jgi:hypothetical protein
LTFQPSFSVPTSEREPQFLSIGLTERSVLGPAVVFVVVALAVYAMYWFVFKKQNVGGFAWFLPFIFSSAIGIYFYREQCKTVGVMTDRESVQYARNVMIAMSLVCVITLSVTQRSLASGLISALLGLPLFFVMFVAGLFFVKTQLLMNDHPDRGGESRLGVVDLEKMRAEFRQQRGIQDMPHNSLMSATAATTDYASNDEVQAMQQSNPLPVPRRLATHAATVSTAPATSAALDSPSTPAALASQPAPLQSEDEIRKKILEVRAKALKAQRKAEKLAERSHKKPKPE